MKQNAETITNIALVVISLLILAAFIKNSFLVSHPHQTALLLPGRPLPAPRGYDWNKHDYTLLLALKQNCIYCIKSMPFYRRLTLLEQSQQITVHLLAIFPDDQLSVKNTLMAEHLNLEAIPNIALQSVNIVGTPTLVLLDHTGHIMNSWEGQLPSDFESQVIREMEKYSHTHT